MPFLATFVGIGLLLLACFPAAANAAPAPPYHQCPAVGGDTSCGVLIVINSDGSTSTYVDKSQPPYDGSEDVLVGVLNDSSSPVDSLPLTGSDIFGLDGDGLCSGYFSGTPSGCPFGPTGYEGPGTSFQTSNANTGSVLFTGGLGPRASAYFSLEGVASSIRPATSCSSSPTSAATAALITAFCELVQTESRVLSAQRTFTALVKTFPTLHKAGASTALAHPPADNYTVPPDASVTAKELATLNVELEFLRGVATDLYQGVVDKLTDPLVKKLLGGDSCLLDLAKAMSDYEDSDKSAIEEDQSASEILNDVLAGKLYSSAIATVIGHVDKADKDLLDKLKAFLDELKALTGNTPSCASPASRPVIVVVEVEIAVVEDDYAQLASDLKQVAFVPSTGFNIESPLPGTTGLAIIFDQAASAITALGLPQNAHVILPSLPPLTTSTSSLGVGGGAAASAHRRGAGGSLRASGGGFAPSSKVEINLSRSTTHQVVQANAQGRLAATVTVSSKTANGPHELYAIGTKPGGGLRVQAAVITITGGHPAKPLRCTGLVTGHINSGLRVPPGFPCTLSNARVMGNVNIGSGGSLDADSSTIAGGISAASPTVVSLCGDHVTGGISVDWPAFPVLIGNRLSPLCAPTSIGGRIAITYRKRPTYPVRVILSGAGTGHVNGSGMACRPTCSAELPAGTIVSLTARAPAGSRFTGWSGPCTGTGACSFVVTSAKSVTARFGRVANLKVVIAGSGSGSVSGTSISCPKECTETKPYGTQATLTATAGSGSYFAGWSGPCTGTSTCTFTMMGDQTVTATFNEFPAGYTVDVDESGVTTSGSLGGTGSLQASGSYIAEQECAPSSDGGPFSIGAYPPKNCAQVGRVYSSTGSPETPSSLWATGNQNCVNAGRSDSGATFTWHVQLPETGHWHVLVYIPNWTSYGFGDQYILNADDGQFQNTGLTQQAYHGQWVGLFGEHQFTAGHDYTVQLTLADSADSNCHYQMADQMEWVYDGP